MSLERLISVAQLAGWTRFVTTTQVEPHGIIYCGANRGQMIPTFLELGFEHVLAIEPQDEAFAQLRRYESEAIRCVQSAVGSTNGMRTFYQIPLIDTMSSLKKPGRDSWKEIVGDLPEEMWAALIQETEVETVTLDALLKDFPAAYNVMALNIQGGELDALQGAESVLPQIEAIHTELNFVSRYEGCALFEELDAWLTERGFDCVHLLKNSSMGYSFGEGWYVNTRSEQFQKRKSEREQMIRDGLSTLM